MQGASSFSSAFLVLRGALHVTIAFKAEASRAETDQMEFDLQRMIAPLMPFRLEIGNYCQMGQNNTIPAYKAKITDQTVWEAVKAFYKLHYRETPGKRCFPTLKLHITTKTANDLNVVENIIREGYGYVMIREAKVENRLDEPDIQYGHYEVPPTAPPPQQQVVAPSSGSQISYVYPNGDWWCASCQFKVFGSKKQCGKCKTQKPHPHA